MFGLFCIVTLILSITTTTCATVELPPPLSNRIENDAVVQTDPSTSTSSASSSTPFLLRDAMFYKKNNHTNITVPIIDTNISQLRGGGHTQEFELIGYDAVYLKFEVPAGSAMDIVVFLKDGSCKPQRVTTTLKRGALPKLFGYLWAHEDGNSDNDDDDKKKNNDGHGGNHGDDDDGKNSSATTSGGESTRTADDNSDTDYTPDKSLGARLHRAFLHGITMSWMCMQQPEVAFSIKETKEKMETWYLLIQTRYPIDTTASYVEQLKETTRVCNIDAYYTARPRTTLNLEVALVIFIPIALAAWGSVAVFRLVTRPTFRTWHWSLVGITRLHFFLPMYMQVHIVRGILWVYEWCTGKLDERKRRRAQEESELLSPRSRATTDDIGEGAHDDDVEMSEASTSAGATSTQSTAATQNADEDEEEEEVVCRICREDGTFEALIEPCECTGSCRYVHQTCLDKWRMECSQRRHINAQQCEICKTDFKVNVKKVAISKAVAFRCLESFVLLVCLYIVFIVSSWIARISVGELSCMAPYHRTDWRSPFGMWSILFGAMSYGFAVVMIFIGLYYTFLEYYTNPDNFHRELMGGEQEEFWTGSRRLVILRASYWPISVFVGVGYVTKYIVYTKVETVPWNFELALFVGAAIVGVTYLLVATIVLIALAFKRSMTVEHHVEEEGRQQTADGGDDEQAAAQQHGSQEPARPSQEGEENRAHTRTTGEA